MKKINYRYNSRRYKLAQKKDEERINRMSLQFLISELHQLTFLTAVKISETALLNGSLDPRREIVNTFEAYQFIQLLRKMLSHPGTDLKLEGDWPPTDYCHLTMADLVKALSPQARAILIKKNIKL